MTATVDKFTHLEPFTFHFGVPAELDSTGTVIITPENLQSTSGVPGVFTTISATGDATIGGDTVMTGGLLVGGTIGVTGATTVNDITVGTPSSQKTLTVNGTTILEGLVEIGDGSDAATLLILKDDGTDGKIDFTNDIAGVNNARWSLLADSTATNPVFKVVRSDSFGVPVDSVDFSPTTGVVTFPTGIAITTGTVTLPAAAALNTYALPIYIKNIISATAVHAYVVIPEGGGGTIHGVDMVADATTAAGALTVTLDIGGVAVTGGVVTINSGVAAGTKATQVAPSAANTVIAGSVVGFLVGGGNVTAGTANVTVSIRRT